MESCDAEKTIETLFWFWQKTKSSRLLTWPVLSTAWCRDTFHELIFKFYFFNQHSLCRNCRTRHSSIWFRLISNYNLAKARYCMMQGAGMSSHNLKRLLSRKTTMMSLKQSVIFRIRESCQNPFREILLTKASLLILVIIFIRERNIQTTNVYQNRGWIGVSEAHPN